VAATLLGPGVFAGLTSLIICLFAHPIGARLGILDAPDGNRKLHARITPLVGGLAVVVPVVAISFWYAVTTSYLPLFGMLGIIVAAFWFLGMIDDRQHLRPIVRLGLSVVICYAVLFWVPGYAVSFFRFGFVDDVLFLDFWTVPFTLICLVGLQNSVNMADGRNGLVPGIALIWSLLIFAYAPPYLYPVLVALVVGLAVVLAFNLAGRLFLGDSGCYALSVLIGLLAIHTYYIQFPILHADVVALWFLIPVVDCLRLMTGRMLAGASPFSADRNHLHHVIGAMMPWHFGLPLYLGLVAGPGLAALAEPEFSVAWAIVPLSIYGVIMALGGRLARPESAPTA